MTALTLHHHPLSSYCQKVEIAIDVLGVVVEKRLLDLGNPAQRAAFLGLWPTGKMPLLVDDGRPVAESSIIIEHLQRRHARSGAELIPADADAALEVRLWDRLLDLYVMTPMQALTGDLLRPPGAHDPTGVAQARERLMSSYGFLDRRMDGRTWVVGETFTLADCAAAPSLFYAVTHVPLPAQHRQLAAYFDRLMDHPAVARTIDAARPHFRHYPGRAGLADRFRDPA